MFLVQLDDDIAFGGLQFDPWVFLPRPVDADTAQGFGQKQQNATSVRKQFSGPIVAMVLQTSATSCFAVMEKFPTASGGVANAVQARTGYGVRIGNRFSRSRQKRQVAARCKEYGVRAAFCRGNVRVVGPEGKGGPRAKRPGATRQRQPGRFGRTAGPPPKAAPRLSSSVLFETGCTQ
jgi:hypothetical protein